MNQELLDILENLESYRQKIVSGELKADAEHAIRICEAHVADFGPWNSRAEWQEALRKEAPIDVFIRRCEKVELPKGEIAEVQERNERMDKLAPKCSWDKTPYDCTKDELKARIEYRDIMAVQSKWEVERGL